MATAALLATVAIVIATAWPQVGVLPWQAFPSYGSSPQWHGDRFANPQAMYSALRGGIWQIFQSRPGETPDGPVPTVDASAAYRQPPASGLRITWFGHSSMLLEMDGSTMAIDPFWSERTSPFPWLGPKRWYAPPVPLEHLPKVDVVVISHDHYDHLDRTSVLYFSERGARFVVPLGIGAHLRAWGVPSHRITELDWWQQADVGAVRVVSTPSRHASGRLSAQSDHTLWTGYAFVGPRHRVFYTGDTGMHGGFGDVGRRLGPFDVALVESGQYDAQWPDWHLGPEQAVLVAHQVGAKHMVPVHWGLVKLAHHAWTEPVERVLAAARCQGVSVWTPQPGQPFEPDQPPAFTRWWPHLPTHTAAERPIVASLQGDPSHLFAVPACP